MAEEFTMETFSDRVNTTFQMHYGSQTAPLEVVSVTDLGSTPRQIQFSVIFRAPVTAPIHQGIYRVDHDSAGPFDLFLVPIARDADGVQYQAVFNRFIEWHGNCVQGNSSGGLATAHLSTGGCGRRATFAPVVWEHA